MKTFIAAATFLLCTALPTSAETPDDLAGRIVRSQGGWSGLRTAAERTLLFKAGGRYATLYYLTYHTVGGTYSYAYSDGTYEYRKTSSAAATLTLHPGTPDAASELFFLTTEADGRWQSPDGRLIGTFALSALSDPAPLVNISTRANTRPGNSIIAGFIVGGDKPREVLIRAIGPGLTELGIQSARSDPDYDLYSLGTQTTKVPWPVGRTGDWSANETARKTIASVSEALGLPPLKPGSRDAADVVRLAPGGYTVNLEAVSPDPGGEVLIEVFLLP